MTAKRWGVPAWTGPDSPQSSVELPDVDDEPRGLDEDCADGLHGYCLTCGCTCECHR